MVPIILSSWARHQSAPPFHCLQLIMRREICRGRCGGARGTARCRGGRRRWLWASSYKRSSITSPTCTACSKKGTVQLPRPPPHSQSPPPSSHYSITSWTKTACRHQPLWPQRLPKPSPKCTTCSTIAAPPRGQTSCTWIAIVCLKLLAHLPVEAILVRRREYLAPGSKAKWFLKKSTWRSIMARSWIRLVAIRRRSAESGTGLKSQASLISISTDRRASRNSTSRPIARRTNWVIGPYYSKSTSILETRVPRRTMSQPNKIIICTSSTTRVKKIPRLFRQIFSEIQLELIGES